MSCQAAVRTLLGTDPTLSGDYGITVDRIWPAQALDGAPRSGYFLVLRWEETSLVIGEHGPEVLTVWCHRSRNETTDFTGHRAILRRVRDILTDAHNVPGPDGTFNQAHSDGYGPDVVDDYYNTITKNAAFRVLSR